MHILIKYDRKGTKSKRFNSIDDAVDYMEGNDFTKYLIWKVTNGGRKIRISPQTADLDAFKKLLMKA
jgi:uncharacterized protein YaaR (DUF327 family)